MATAKSTRTNSTRTNSTRKPPTRPTVSRSDASQVKELKASDKLAIVSAPTAQMHTIILQTKDPLLANKSLRQAIAAALDTTQIVQAVSDGFGAPNNSVVPSASAYYTAVEKQGFKYDPEKARKLLREAGYKGETIKLLTNKRPIVPSFEVSVIAQAMLQAVGVNVVAALMRGRPASPITCG